MKQLWLLLSSYILLLAASPETINGHVLPPEPDPKVNNATLLGIDSNGNGVRDDLERYICKRFNGYEHAAKERAVAMQHARALQKILVDPELAWENKTYEIFDQATYCLMYYTRKYKPYNIAYDIFDADFKDQAFNTRERVKAYFQYNKSLGGHMFTLGSITADRCDEPIDDLE